MKALLLSAGEGKRLRPITWFKPKCLVKVGIKTVIQHQIDKLHSVGIKEIIVNIHHLPKQMIKIPDVLFFYEPHLLGEKNLGTIMALRSWLNNDSFIVINSDTLNELDYRKMIEYAKGRDKPILFWGPVKNVYAGVSVYPSHYFDHRKKAEHYMTYDYWCDMGTFKGLKEARKHYK